MLLIINTADMINDERYVKPIKEVLGKRVFVRHMLEVKEIPENISKIIIAGNSIFSSNLSVGQIRNVFKWLDDFDKPVLGICAGQQIIAQYFGSRVSRHDARGLKKFVVKHRDKILKDVKSKFNGYVSHNFAVPCPKDFEVLARANTMKVIPEYLAKHKTRPIYITTFHPEFSEKQIIENFSNL